MANKQSVVIAGGSGLVGSRLIHWLQPTSDLYILTRGKSRKSQNSVQFIHWDIEKKKIDAELLPDRFHLINLTGAGVADKRWTDERKKIIIDSRVDSTMFLTELSKTYQVDAYIGASAIGYYGDRKEEILTIESEPGSGFMSECCIKWEDAHASIKQLVNSYSVLRIGIVLSNLGGALPKLVQPAKLGVAAYFGNGKMHYAWIHIDDLCLLILHIMNQGLNGIIHGTTPMSITLKDLVKSMKQAYASYALLLPAPTLPLRLALGEMASVLTNSTRIEAKEIEQTGFTFQHKEIGQAMLHLAQNREI